MTKDTVVERPWREHLTEAEAAEIAQIEAEASELDERRSALTWRRIRIQNRATQRCRTHKEQS